MKANISVSGKLEPVDIICIFECAGRKAFVHRVYYTCRFKASDWETGWGMGPPCSHVEEAIEQAINLCKSAGPENMRERLSVAMAKSGIANKPEQYDL